MKTPGSVRVETDIKGQHDENTEEERPGGHRNDLVAAFREFPRHHAVERPRETREKSEQVAERAHGSDLIGREREARGPRYRDRGTDKELPLQRHIPEEEPHHEHIRDRDEGHNDPDVRGLREVKRAVFKRKVGGDTGRAGRDEKLQVGSLLNHQRLSGRLRDRRENQKADRKTGDENINRREFRHHAFRDDIGRAPDRDCRKRHQDAA